MPSQIKKMSDIKINVTYLKYIKYRKKNYINVTDRNCELKMQPVSKFSK